MANPLARAIAPTLTVIDGQPTTTSADVAHHFGKRHDDVLKAIRNLLPQLSAEHARNFAEMFTETQIGQGATRQDPAYRITKKGFTLLAFGFTGKKALQFKLDYIDEFERLEAELSGKAGQLPGPHPQPALPNALRQTQPPELPAIDVRMLLLSGQCNSQTYTREIYDAIDKQAWAMAGEAFELLREHLRRRVAFMHTSGIERRLHEKAALQDIKTVTLGQALAHTYISEMRYALSGISIAATTASNAEKRVRAQIDQLTQQHQNGAAP